MPTALSARLKEVEAELSCREKLIKDHLRKIMHLENRVEDEAIRAEAAEAKLAIAREALAHLHGAVCGDTGLIECIRWLRALAEKEQTDE